VGDWLGSWRMRSEDGWTGGRRSYRVSRVHGCEVDVWGGNELAKYIQQSYI
jgi:uncharacterized protein (DUF2384 family)